MSEKINSYVPEGTSAEDEKSRLEAWGLDDHTMTPKEYMQADTQDITKNTYEDVFGNVDRVIGAGNNTTYREVESLLDDNGLETEGRVHVVESGVDSEGIYSNLGLQELAELARDAQAHNDKSTSLEAQTAIQNRLEKLVAAGKITEAGAMNRIDQLDTIINGAVTESQSSEKTGSEEGEPKTDDEKMPEKTPGQKAREANARGDEFNKQQFAAAAAEASSNIDTDPTDPIAPEKSDADKAKEKAEAAKALADEAARNVDTEVGTERDSGADNQEAIENVINSQDTDPTPEADNSTPETPRQGRIRKLGSWAVSQLSGFRRRRSEKRAKKHEAILAKDKQIVEGTDTKPLEAIPPLRTRLQGDHPLTVQYTNANRAAKREQNKDRLKNTKKGFLSLWDKVGDAAARAQVVASPQGSELSKQQADAVVEEAANESAKPAPVQTEPITSLDGSAASPADTNKTEVITTDTDNKTDKAA